MNKLLSGALDSRVYRSVHNPPEIVAYLLCAETVKARNAALQSLLLSLENLTVTPHK
jgi:hypothetical protein